MASVWICCILSKFHIKPQHADTYLAYWDVVSYRNSTSNHNTSRGIYRTGSVVSYRNSTSNHNSAAPMVKSRIVVSYRNSTSNHNREMPFCNQCALYLIEIPHQTTTSQGNKWWTRRCILSKFHIKPQPLGSPLRLLCRCILSKFHIKPQHRFDWFFLFRVVSYRNSTSNHNFRSVPPTLSRVVSYRNSTSNHNTRNVIS